VREVDQDPLIDHRVHDLAPDRGEAFVVGLRKDSVVEPVGQERQRGGVGRDIPEEEVRNRHVGHSHPCEGPNVALDFRTLAPKLETSLDRVDQDRDAVAQQRVEFTGRVGDCDIAAMRLDVVLNRLVLLDDVVEIALPRRGAVGLGQVHLVERLVEH